MKRTDFRGDKMRNIVLLAFLCVTLSSCLYSNVRFPLDEDLWETKLGSKVGVASSHSVAWLVAWGDAGTKAAAENGGITKIQHADTGIKSILFGLYMRRDTIVYGD
jgi:hypothetical protein